MPENRTCPICHRTYSDTTTCPFCYWNYKQDLKAGILPPGLDERFFYLKDWQYFRSIEQMLETGKISRADAETKAQERIKKLLEHQETVLERERQAKKSEAERRTKYLY